MEDRSSMGMNSAGVNEDTDGPDVPTTGLPEPATEPTGGEPGMTRDPLPAGLPDGAFVAKTVVAVDGPAGSGKSSVSRAAARVLGYDYLDTGAAYRAFAWHAIQLGVDLTDATPALPGVASFDYSIGTDPDDYWVRVGDTDVTEAIRTPEVTAAVASVARVPEVRAGLVSLFRNIMRKATAPGIVTEGRDITTVVAPDAEVRILLTADESVRMARRSAEVTTQSAEETARALSQRDRQDSRVVDFMNAADGVITVDSTDLDFDQTVQAVVDLARAATH